MEQELNFEELLNSIPKSGKNFEGFLTKGTIVDIRDDMAVVDAGLKAEGRVSLANIKKFEKREDIKVGDVIDVYVERLENNLGDIVLSVEKANREKVWLKLENAMKDGTSITGVIYAFVKAGFSVNIDGVVGFLPKSQLDVRPIKDTQEILNVPLEFKIIKVDRARNNVVVSRRAHLEDERADARMQFVQDLEENQIVEGVVKNITDYGAFVDLGGVDGLLHVIDISWKRINHPSDVLKVGDTIKVKVIRFNKETGRISLGMKQLGQDPWLEIKDSLKIGDEVTGEITNLTDYGAFVQLEPGIEGLIYITEISWTKKNAHPAEFLKQNQKVKVKIMDVDLEKKRVSLSYKRCLPNPWQAYLEAHPAGTVVKGQVKNVTEFGIFVSLTPELDGMVNLLDLETAHKNTANATEMYQKGQEIEVVVLDVSPEKERISLGLKKNESKDTVVKKESAKAD
ncbi:MAG: 30S ribosomal protein S1 [Alphaproteobacteria bacterium]|nr:MAG: 30S ribosomal protein S1 [Alphaproteobacteria bacterium]